MIKRHKIITGTRLRSRKQRDVTYNNSIRRPAYDDIRGSSVVFVLCWYAPAHGENMAAQLMKLRRPLFFTSCDLAWLRLSLWCSGGWIRLSVYCACRSAASALFQLHRYWFKFWVVAMLSRDLGEINFPSAFICDSLANRDERLEKTIGDGDNSNIHQITGWKARKRRWIYL